MGYFVILSSSLFFSLLYRKTNNSERYLVFYWILCIYCILFFGFRYRVGFDTINYHDQYDNILPLYKMNIEDFFGNKHAPLYGLLESFCKTLSPNFYVLQIMVSILFNIPLFYYLKRNSENPFLSFFVFFVMIGCYFNTDIMRESLAVIISLFNYENIRKRKYLRYYLCAIIALGFHYTAIVTFIFPFISFVKFNKYYVLYLIIFVALVRFVSEFIFSILTIDYLQDQVLAKLFGLGQHNFNWFIFRISKYILLPFLILVYYKVSGYQHKLYENLTCLYVLFGIGILFYEVFFIRFANYAFIPFSVFFANVLLTNKLHSKLQVLRLPILSLMLLIYSFGYLNNRQYRAYYPYYSIFDPHEDKERENQVYEWRLFN